MRLLDTNHASRIIERDLGILARLAELSDEEYAINAVVEGELLFMALNSGRRRENTERVQAFLATVRIYGIESGSARIYAELKAGLYRNFGPSERTKRRRTTIANLGFQDNDLWIAATAIEHDLTVVSADSDFTRISEVRPLRLESWLA